MVHFEIGLLLDTMIAFPHNAELLAKKDEDLLEDRGEQALWIIHSGLVFG